MASIGKLLEALEERTIAREIGIPHDEARMAYSLRSNMVDGDFDQFSEIIGDYYNYHFTQCVTKGGNLSVAEAAGRAEELVEREYRRQQGDIVLAYNNAHDGTNGGLRLVLDIIAEGLKAEAVERYIRDVFDRHIAPNAWGEKVDLIRQFIEECGSNLSSSISPDQPERYAHNYQELIRSYVSALQRTSSIFRRM